MKQRISVLVLGLAVAFSDCSLFKSETKPNVNELKYNSGLACYNKHFCEIVAPESKNWQSFTEIISKLNEAAPLSKIEEQRKSTGERVLRICSMKGKETEVCCRLVSESGVACWVITEGEGRQTFCIQLRNDSVVGDAQRQ